MTDMYMFIVGILVLGVIVVPVVVIHMLRRLGMSKRVGREDVRAASQELRARLVALTPRVFVTQALIVANVVVFVAMVTVGRVDALAPSAQSLIPWGADYGPYTTGGQWWRLLTSTFVH